MSRLSQHICILLGLLLLAVFPACVDSELRFRLGEEAQAPVVSKDATTDGGGAKDGSGGEVTAKDTDESDGEETKDTQKDTTEDIKVDVGPPPPVPCVEDADCNGVGFDPGICNKAICDIATGFCRGEPIEGCCTDSADCVDEELCTIDTCVGGQCFHAPAEGCCTLDNQCDDDDPCSLDICTVDFACG
ncbi:MAG: hypothetical protein VX938_06970, partial [Myxococcota bacterium]|nr:hypothetical protein [Myxococcota bacterium]